MGMALFRLAHQDKTLKDLRQALEAPLKTILGNAGLPIRKSIKRIRTRALEAVIDVKTNEIGTPKELGIIDGLSSVDTAVKNASSIAVNYLRAYVVIGR
jgi:chaperonin GroEL (HSP60 family)